MYQHILLPIDGSELFNKAIPQGIELARSIGARVTGLHVPPPFHTVSVMAYHGRRGMAALVLGRETHKVLTHGTIPTLVGR